MRLRAHGALCRGMLEARCHADTELPETPLAEAMLTDATAFIEEFPMRDNGRNRSLIYLRKAELAIIRAGSVTAFAQLRSQIRDGHDSAEGSIPDVLNSVASWVHDALRWLTRSEQELLKQRKSRWWWWIFLVLKCKASEYLYVLQTLAVIEHERRTGSTLKPSSDYKADEVVALDVVPPGVGHFLGVELVQRIAETRLCDLFYLARITYSYAQALRCKITQERIALRRNKLPAEVERTRETIRRRREILAKLIALGTELASKAARSGGSSMDPAVFVYWESSLTAAHGVAAQDRSQEESHSAGAS